MDFYTFPWTIETLPPVKTFTKICTIVQLIYGIPSLILMFFFLFFLRTYTNSFYRLVQLDLLTNIICCLNTWTSIRLLVYKSGLNFLIFLETLIPGSLTFSNILINFFLHTQFCSAISLSIHRLSSVLFPFRFDKFWARYYLLIGVIFIIYSLLPFFSIPGISFKFFIDNGTLYETVHGSRVEAVVLQSAILSIIYFLLLLFVGIITSVLVSKTVQEYNVSDRGIGKKLTKIALTYCLVFSGILFWSVISAVNNVFEVFDDVFFGHTFEFLAFSSDGMTLALPYIMLIFDNNVRRDILKRRNGIIGVDTIVVSHSATNLS